MNWEYLGNDSGDQILKLHKYASIDKEIPSV